jgi:transposase
MAASKFIRHDTIKSLKRNLRQKEYIGIRDRIRAIIMIMKDYPYREIADNLGYSIQWVKKLAVDYTDRGFEGLVMGVRGGSQSLLNPDQYMELFRIILEGPGEGDLLSRYRINDLIKIVKDKWGIEYSVGGMHKLLKRMKFSHITTRPQNPKNDPAVMEIWKKKPKNSLTRKRKSTGALKSGSKMKRGSGKKA